MPKWLVVLLFVAGAAVSWGVYVPLVHRAAMQLQSNLRAFLFVGVAYFLVAVLVPVVMIFVMNWDPDGQGGPQLPAVPIFWGIASRRCRRGGRVVRHFRGDECGTGRRDLCCAARVCRSADHQYVRDDLLFPPGENVPRLEVLPGDRSGGRGGGNGDAV